VPSSNVLGIGSQDGQVLNQSGFQIGGDYYDDLTELKFSIMSVQKAHVAVWTVGRGPVCLFMFEKRLAITGFGGDERVDLPAKRPIQT